MSYVSSEPGITPVFRPNSAAYRWRLLASTIGWSLMALMFGLLAMTLVAIIAFVIIRGGANISWATFTQTTQSYHGLLNAIEGSVLVTFGALLIAAPVGIVTGIFLSEYQYLKAARLFSFLCDVLIGVPSIVLGMFGYIAMVNYLGWQFSLLAGCITLAAMIVPYIARTSEMALLQVPGNIREAAYALGAGDRTVIFRVVLVSCVPQILNGVLYAAAISMGETAPLIYTAGWSNYSWNGHFFHEPVGYLTYVIWSFISEPSAAAHQLAYVAAFLTTLFALLINLFARSTLRRKNAPH